MFSFCIQDWFDALNILFLVAIILVISTSIYYFTKYERPQIRHIVFLIAIAILYCLLAGIIEFFVLRPAHLETLKKKFASTTPTPTGWFYLVSWQMSKTKAGQSVLSRSSLSSSFHRCFHPSALYSLCTIAVTHVSPCCTLNHPSFITFPCSFFDCLNRAITVVAVCRSPWWPTLTRPLLS